MKKNLILLLASGAALLVLSAAAVFAIYMVRWGAAPNPIPARTKLNLPPANPIQIRMTGPGEGGVFAINGSVPVSVSWASRGCKACASGWTERRLARWCPIRPGPRPDGLSRAVI